jgi:2-polyprenyl-6-methoxyphenol hydroxylase-like FAD-dependent oxidoreductase
MNEEHRYSTALASAQEFASFKPILLDLRSSMVSADLRVIIVGGGVSGLTLANALEKSRVDYVLLERRDEIAPKLGASIAITAGGGRILDQLNCYDVIQQKTTPIETFRAWHSGKLLRENDGPLFNHKRQVVDEAGFSFSRGF